MMEGHGRPTQTNPGDRGTKRRDGNGIDAKTIKNHPDKFATPHALTVDSRGDFYVVEWVPYGRVRKFRHTPA